MLDPKCTPLADLDVDQDTYTIPVVAGEEGKFKVSSLRNIARTAPYGHNGFFPTLYDIVHFYNTRDCRDEGVPSSNVPDAYCHIAEQWASAEVPLTVNNSELGALGLTFEEEQKIVVFLETLQMNSLLL